MPTVTKENYLKAIISLSRNQQKVSITALADKMQVSKPTANDMVKKMKLKNWLVYEKYKPLQLTPEGEKVAALIVRKHRLAEMFLAEVMGFGWEEVHEIAEDIEHLRSQKFFDRMDEILGFPTVDPHGSPIPDKEGKIPNLNYLNLTALKKGEKGILRGLTKSNKDLLVYLNKKKIKLGTELIIHDIESFDKSFEVLLEDNRKITLTFDACQRLLVEKF
jgi:DtxR family Mn-dependent transcriptional regulator